MDSVTQIALGAAVGEAVLGRKVGNKAPLWGAVFGTIPDLDVFAGHFLDTVDRLWVHRGLSHSVLFSIVMAPLFGWLLYKFYKKETATWQDWSLLAFGALLTHPLLDAFTTWGTQLFWPLNYRIALKSIFVIDPLYTLPLLICLFWLLFLPKNSQKRKRLNTIGIAISSLYLAITVVNKSVAAGVFEKALQGKNISYIDFETKPTPLNSIFWSVTAEVDSGYYIGYYSFFDEDKNIDFHFFPKSHYLLNKWKNEEKLQKLLYLTKGYYTVEKASKGFHINDLRFGQLSGWQTGDADFVFVYHIWEENGQLQVAQVENDFKEGRKLLKEYFQRILGKTKS